MGRCMIIAVPIGIQRECCSRGDSDQRPDKHDIASCRCLRLLLSKGQRFPGIVDQDIVYRLATESSYPHSWDNVV